MKFHTTNPATEEQLKEFETMPAEKVLGIVQKVHNSFLEWKQLSIKERGSHFLKLAEVLRKNKEKYARAMSLEMGKPLKDALGEIEKCAWCAQVYVENAEKWLHPTHMEGDGVEHKVMYQPLGVILAIMPWNFPFWQVFRFAIPTLLAGNTALLKHASNVTESALFCEEAFKEAGFPNNTFRTIIADHPAIRTVLKSTFIRGVSLTGSTQAGKGIGSKAGKELKKVVLELGGSDPFIVLEDADLDIAVKGAIAGRFMNCGQSCIASKRFIVHEKIAEEFAKKFAESAGKLNMGDPFEKDTDLGPLVNKKAMEKINEQVQDAVAKGATVLTGGKRMGEKGFFYAPTVITDTNSEMSVTTEEVFGPVAAIIKVKDDEEALKVANSLEFGLGGSVWTKDLDRGKKMAEQIESGTVFVNSITKSDPRMPFGGIKESGIGRELSSFGIKEFVNIKGFNVYEHK